MDTVLNGKPRTGGVGGGGVKVFTMSPGESVSLELPEPGGASSITLTGESENSGGRLPVKPGEKGRIQVDHADFYRGRDEAIILTVTRED
jgi:hypothetical protein